MKKLLSMILPLIFSYLMHAQIYEEAPEKWTIPVKIYENAQMPFINWSGNKLYYRGYGIWNYLLKTDSGWSAPIQLDSNIITIPFPEKLVISPDEKTLYLQATTFFKIYRSFWNDSLNQWGPASLLLDNGINSGGVEWEVTNFIDDTTMILQELCEGRISYFDSLTNLWSAPKAFPCSWCSFCVSWGAWVSIDKKKLYACEDTYTLGRGRDLCVSYVGPDSNYLLSKSLNISLYMDSLYQLGEIAGNDELFLTLTPDGRTMYFSANYDTFGRYDVYETKMFIDENGDTVLTGVEDNQANILPEKFFIYSPFPNPFNSTTTIKYELKESTYITIKIYDILGNEIKTILNAEQKGGVYTHRISAEDISSGTYILSFKTNFGSAYRKITLLK